MSLETIAFLVSFIALIYLSMRNKKADPNQADQLDSKEDPDRIEGDPLKEFMRTLERETDKVRHAHKKIHPPPTPKPVPAKASINHSQSKKQVSNQIEAYHLKSQVEARHLQDSLEKRRLKNGLEERRSSIQLANKLQESAPVEHKKPRGIHLLNRLPRLKDMVIYYEIFNKPKGL